MKEISKSENQIFRTYSLAASINLLIARAVLIAIVLYGGFHIRENPIVICVLILIMLLLLGVSGNESIVIKNTHFVFEDGSLIKLLLSKKEFHFSEIRLVEANGIGSQLTNSFTKMIPIHSPRLWNKIVIHYCNGKVKELRTTIEISQLRKASEIINRELKNQNHDLK